MYIPPEEWQAPPTEDEISESPWKYIGYKEFTSFTASNPDFFALRRFDRLHTRVLLTLQARLSHYEQRLDELDKHYAAKTTKRDKAKLVDIKDLGNVVVPADLKDVNNGTVRDDLPERAKLISHIQVVLSVYDRTLAEYSSIRAMSNTPRRNITNIRSWFENSVGAIDAEEAKFIDHTKDLVSISSKKPMLRQFFEDFVVFHMRHMFQIFKQLAPESQLSERDRDATYTVDEETLEATGSVAMFIGATTMLIVPLWVLQTVGNLKVKLAVITVFMHLCLLFITLATTGKPLERLAVTAGYAAVLVVFLDRGG